MLVSPSSQRIKLLPEHLIDQIKAGEVIERPSSLIKEVLENALDAQASKIDIHLIDNGMEMISIQDNGHGMTFDEIPLAFARHATSKLSRFEDLYALDSFGFRGEALASIAAISRLTCISSPIEDNRKGGKLEIHGGAQQSLTSWQGQKNGTSLIIKDLFYNTPARLNFIRSKVAEKNAIKKIISAFILSNPKVEFSLKWDDQDKIFYPSVSSQNAYEERIQKVLTRSKRDNSSEKSLLKFKQQYEEHSVEGYISLSSSKGNAGKSHFLFANNRFFFDKSMHQAIINSAKHLWPDSEIGHYYIKLTIPKEKIDVNIHPNKTSINFLKKSIVYSLLSEPIKNLKSPSQSFNPEKNNTSKPRHTSPSHYDYLIGNKYLHNDNNTLSNFINLSPAYKLITLGSEDQELIYLLNTNKLFLSLWKRILSLSPLNEELKIPLLISEDLNVEIHNKDEIDLYSSIGIDIDIVNKSHINVQSIPEIASGVSTKNLVHHLIKIIKKNNIKLLDELKDFVDTLISSPQNKDDFDLSISDILSIMKKIDFQELVLNRSIIAIDNQNLIEFLNQND